MCKNHTSFLAQLNHIALDYSIGACWIGGEVHGMHLYKNGVEAGSGSKRLQKYVHTLLHEFLHILSQGLLQRL